MGRRFTKKDALAAIVAAVKAVEARRKTIAMFKPFLTREADK
jgi:hypothetical protein